jgi:hypothetical protein
VGDRSQSPTVYNQHRLLMKLIYGERENAAHTGKSVEASRFPHPPSAYAPLKHVLDDQIDEP